MDEASLSKQEAFDILIGRLREGGEQGWMTATFTPKGKAHWTYKTFGTGQPDTELVHAQSDENPFLPPTFVLNVRKRYTEQQAKQELRGVFIDGGGNHYFPGLWPRYVDAGDAYRIQVGDRRRHIRKVECSRLLALDWAMGKPKNDAKSKQAAALGALKGDHTAFVVADMDPETGALYLLDCLNERIPIGSNAPRLAEFCRRWNPVVVAGDDDNLSETMLLETRRYRDIPTAKPMAIGGKNKLVRSQAAIVRAERGMMFLPQEDGRARKWVETLSDQLAEFTGADGEQDDIADCFGILGRLADEFKPGDSTDGYDPVLGAAGYGGGEMYGTNHDGDW
jgi:Phage terminase large subunit